ncbi:MAG TPA: SDR family oxidoreductase [Acidimicrobiales bacterium]|nr:SDR family oxidoreductase [Acidimicrobiales bacterium]
MSTPRTVVITGASSGIGEATALRLSKAGWKVLAGVRTSDDSARLRRESDGKIEPVALDVTEPMTILALVDQLDDRGLDGLVNNAGIAVSSPLEYLPIAELRRQLEVNLVGQIAVTQAFLPQLRRARGRIINVGSIAGRSSLPFLGAYAASKYALEAVTDALRVEVRPFGIAVVILEPGTIATPIWRKGAETFERLSADWPAEFTALYGDRINDFREAARAAARRGVPADKVARTIEIALSAKRPKTRYLVGRDARRRARVEHLPDRLRDRAYERALFRA